MKNRVQVVYLGNRETLLVAWGAKRYPFTRGEASWVPEDLAEKLCRTEDYVLAHEAGLPLDERFPGEAPVVVRRWGAVGDLLMFRAVCSAFLRAQPGRQLILRTDPIFAGLFAEDPLWMEVWTARKKTSLPGMNFNQVAEADHRSTSPDSRIALFSRAMTNNPLELTAQDWELPIPDEAVRYVAGWMRAKGLAERTRPLVAVQRRGSGRMKSIPDEQIRELCEALGKFATVVLIERDPAKAAEIPGVLTMTGRDPLHSIELLKHVDLCVCFDSGVLWMAHCAPCPVLCIMGPTRPEQRLTYHPYFPAGARAVCLNETVELKVKGGGKKTGCPACFERAEACSKTFACMQANPTAVQRIVAAAEEMLGPVRVSLPQAKPKMRLEQGKLVPAS